MFGGWGRGRGSEGGAEGGEAVRRLKEAESRKGGGEGNR